MECYSRGGARWAAIKAAQTVTTGEPRASDGPLAAILVVESDPLLKWPLERMLSMAR